MGTFSIWHWVIVLVVVLVLFGGRGKNPSLMGDVAKGIKSFKSNMIEEKSGANTAPEIEADNETDKPLAKDDQSTAKD